MSAVADVLRFGFVELNANLALAFVLPVGVVLVFVVGVFGQPVFEVVVCHVRIVPSERVIVKRENEFGPSPHVSDVVGIDEQESEGNCCDDDDSSHCLFPLLFVSYALIIYTLSSKVNPVR